MENESQHQDVNVIFALTIWSTTVPACSTETEAVELEPKQGQNAKSSNLRFYHDYPPWN